MSGMLTKSFIDEIFEVYKIIGANAVLFMSNDDKTRILLGLATANFQAPLLMHMKYKVKLLDHDFVITQHKLIPSVFLKYAKLLTLVMYRTVYLY